MPGGYLKVALQATDPDGDPVHFSLSSSGPLPTANLQSDGTLVFTPTPSEVGTYNLTLGASDGAADHAGRDADRGPGSGHDHPPFRCCSG